MANHGACIRLKLFGEDIKNLLNGNNWSETHYEDADWIFINSCSFIESKEKESLKTISELYSRKGKDQKIAVFGCLPSTNPDAVKKVGEIFLFRRSLDEIAIFFRLSMNSKISSHIASRKLSFFSKAILMTNRLMREPSISYRLDKGKVFHLKISEGCLGKCTYCSEKFTTTLKSRKIEEVVSAFRGGLDNGYRLFSFNSDDTSCFGLDNNENIYSLLERILKEQREFKLAITEFNPRGLTDKRILDLLCSDKIMFITIPVQSGSQKILNKMKRQYNIQEVLKTIKGIKRINPKLKINTHIIVGFPGETKKDFKDTLKLIDLSLFDRIKIFKYNDRPGTGASLMPGKVSETEKDRRFKILRRKILMNSVRNKSLSNFLMNFRTML